MGAAKNRLANESSPYLLLHAENPVDWYPWGDEAFAKAKGEDKPIFLSVGYSTCYWCHVMERECFSDPEIAKLMNDGFVSVKLDREERPDLDEIYMAATQLLTRSGGWPNSLFLTHDKKPFFAGTYFPPRDMRGRPGFPRVLAAIREAWEHRRPDVLEQAEGAFEAVRDHLGATSAAEEDRPGPDLADLLLSMLRRRFDPEWGGFGDAPKFPSPSNLFFLLDRAAEDEEARSMLVVTLDRMARGGIHDQIGGGFHRYSTDSEWLVPHFEKMLYDNASLALLYAEAVPLAPEAGFERVARRTLDFVLAEMTGPEGAFLSAIDAETDGREGAYYTWTRDELRSILTADQRDLLAPVYGFAGPANFEEDGYVLHLPTALSEQARRLAVSVEELLQRLEPGRRAILEARWRRKRPLVDDKVLTDWNGLMIGAMARAGKRLDEPRYREAARQAADFILAKLRSESGALLHVCRSGTAKTPALLDDYAFLIQGLIRLHEAGGDDRFLREALRLAAEQDRRLWDEEKGGYFAAEANADLIARAKPGADGAVASGNGVSALNLIDLWRLTGSPSFRDRAQRMMQTFGHDVARFPLGHVTLVQALSGLGPEAPDAPRMEDTGAIVAATATLGATQEGGFRSFALELSVREGWHINANPASLPFLVPTEVSAEAELRRLRYPGGEELRAAYAEGPLSVYRGRVRIEGEVALAGGERPDLTVIYQACDDLRCLPTVRQRVPLTD